MRTRRRNPGWGVKMTAEWGGHPRGIEKIALGDLARYLHELGGILHRRGKGMSPRVPFAWIASRHLVLPHVEVLETVLPQPEAIWNDAQTELAAYDDVVRDLEDFQSDDIVGDFWVLPQGIVRGIRFYPPEEYEDPWDRVEDELSDPLKQLVTVLRYEDVLRHDTTVTYAYNGIPGATNYRSILNESEIEQMEEELGELGIDPEEDPLAVESWLSENYEADWEEEELGTVEDWL